MMEKSIAFSWKYFVLTVLSDENNQHAILTISITYFKKQLCCARWQMFEQQEAQREREHTESTTTIQHQ